jgi:hypothetical protein
MSEAGAEATAEPLAILVDKKIGDREYFEHIKKINDTFYDQIKMADQKAAYIFTFLLAFMITSAEGRNVFRLSRYQSDDLVVILGSAILALSLVVAMVSAIMVVLPRVRLTATSLFWGTWDLKREQVRAAHGRMDQDYLFNEYMENATNLALINRSKYRFVSFAFRGLIVAVLAYVLLLVAGGGAAPT